MKGRYSAQEIAKWFINEVHPEPLKLQKLLYLSQGFSFAFFDEPLFKEPMEAWIHGPVVTSIYQEYKTYKFSPINKKYNEIKLDENALEVVNYVKEKYAKYDGKFLEELTHKQEPWILSRKDLSKEDKSDNIIRNHDIANYFISSMFEPDEEEWE